MMKAALMTLALAAVAFAVPFDGVEERHPAKCTPATYSCTPNNAGWQVCDTSGHWVFGGNCAPPNICVFFQPSLSPYCVPPGFQIP